MAHEETMQLHQANLQGSNPPSKQERARLLDKVVESEVEASGASEDALSNFRAKDFPLSNYDEESDTTEFKWMQEILDIFAKARHPHPGSGLHGLARAWATGDPGNRLRPLGLGEMANDEAYKLATFSRAKRGEGGFQQETNAKQVSETHAVRENESSSSGGLMGRFRS